MNINDIKSNIAKTGLARPNLFRVKINRAKSGGESLSMNCFQAQIPGTNILTTDRDIGLRQMSYQRAYADMMMGFYCSGDLKELRFFQNWMHSIVNPKNNHMGYYSSSAQSGGEPGYTSEVIIEQLMRDAVDAGTKETGSHFNVENKIAARWTLEEAFPKQVDPVQLDYGTNDTYMAVTITMTFRKFTANYNPMQGGNEGLSEYDRELGRKDWEWIDPTTGAYKPNKYGTWSNARLF
jgi:hypothetical protein